MHCSLLLWLFLSVGGPSRQPRGFLGMWTLSCFLAQDDPGWPNSIPGRSTWEIIVSVPNGTASLLFYTWGMGGGENPVRVAPFSHSYNYVSSNTGASYPSLLSYNTYKIMSELQHQHSTPLSTIIKAGQAPQCFAISFVLKQCSTQGI